MHFPQIEWFRDWNMIFEAYSIGKYLGITSWHEEPFNFDFSFYRFRKDHIASSARISDEAWHLSQIRYYQGLFRPQAPCAPCLRCPIANSDKNPKPTINIGLRMVPWIIGMPKLFQCLSWWLWGNGRKPSDTGDSAIYSTPGQGSPSRQNSMTLFVHSTFTIRFHLLRLQLIFSQQTGIKWSPWWNAHFKLHCRQHN